MWRSCFGCGRVIKGTPVDLKIVSTTTKNEITIVVCKQCAQKVKKATKEPWSVS